MSESTARALDELADLYMRGREDPEVRLRMRLTQRFGLEPVIGELTALATWSLFSVGSRANDLAASLLEDDELASLRPVDGELDPLITYSGGGHRIQHGLIAGDLLGGAVAQSMIRGLSNDRPVVRALLDEAVDDLKRGVSGDSVTSYSVYGFTGVDLKPGIQLETPWGTLRRAPKVDEERWIGHYGPRCTVILEARLPTKVDLSREANPPFYSSLDDPESRTVLQKGVRELLPIACALGTASGDLAAPALMWETHLVSFSAPTGYSSPLVAVSPLKCPDISDRVAEIRHWADVVKAEHSPNVDIAASRLVSALANRRDPADSLIDAVTAWENLVGSKSETTFRVTAALARLLETDPSRRLAYRKRLAGVYDRRSRVVHGEPEPHDKIAAAADEAMAVAVQALQASYGRGHAWLSLTSQARSDQLLVADA
jgi:hypothetical protein